MKYPKEYLDEIKTRLKVSTVVSKTVSLKKRGKEFVGLSPFKNEKTPSFTVNDEKEFYHCFATSEHGNIFDFIMKTQNLKFGEAVKHLAQLAGMQPYMFSKKDEEREKKWNEYKSIYNEYVKNKKNTVHHFCTFSKDINNDIKFFEDSGYKNVQGGSTQDGGSFAYLDKENNFGAILEIAQLSEGGYAMFEMIKSASKKWDGKDAIMDIGEISI